MNSYSKFGYHGVFGRDAQFWQQEQRLAVLGVMKGECLKGAGRGRQVALWPQHVMRARVADGCHSSTLLSYEKR